MGSVYNTNIIPQNHVPGKKFPESNQLQNPAPMPSRCSVTLQRAPQSLTRLHLEKPTAFPGSSMSQHLTTEVFFPL